MASPAPAIDAELEAAAAVWLPGARGCPRPRSRRRPLPLRVAVDLVVVGAADAERLAGSRWHVVARALREGRQLHVAG